MEKIVGRITHYFPKIGVAVVEIAEDLMQGDEIIIRGSTATFAQKADSMQSEHKNIVHAKKGTSVGLKVNQPVSSGDMVFRTE